MAARSQQVRIRQVVTSQPAAKAADSADTEEVPGGDTGAGNWAGDDQEQ